MNKSRLISTFKLILLGLVLLISFLGRLHRIDSPVADWHSWRQADTASVARNYVKVGKIDLLHPTYDDLSNVASGKENPQGLRMVEFPIYPAIGAFFYQKFAIWKLEIWLRLITIFASLITQICLFIFVKKQIGFLGGWFAAVFYGFLPFSIYYGRVILPDPLMVALSLLALVSLGHYIDKRKLSLLSFGLICFSLALLVKPTAIFFLIPIIVQTVLVKKTNLKQKLIILSLLLLSVLPLFLWRTYIKQFPEGIPASSWLLNGDGIRFKGAFFHWLFGERIGKLILGYWGLVFLGTGIFALGSRRYFTLCSLFVAALVYLFTFATGNVRHDYYQIPILPAVSAACALGASAILNNQFFAKTWKWIPIGGIFILACSLSWYEIRGFYNINHPEIVEAGQAADRLLPPNAKVIAPYDGDTAFLYQINRAGWPVTYSSQSLEPQIKLGATHLVSVNYDDLTKKIMQTYKVLAATEKFVIVDLTTRQ